MEGQAHVHERPGEGAAEHRDGQDVRPREPQRGLTRNPSVERSSVCRSSQIPARDATPGRKRSSHCRPPSTPLGGPGSPLTRLLKGSPRVLSGTYPMVSPSSPTYCGLGAWETTMSRWIGVAFAAAWLTVPEAAMASDRKSTRLNSSHLVISYA